jgi:hypothetical protein
MPAKHKKIKLQLADQQTLLFVRKTTKDVDNENLGNTIKKIPKKKKSPFWGGNSVSHSLILFGY